MTLNETAQQAIAEVSQVLDAAVPIQVELMTGPIRAASRIALYGVGREGLMMKSLAMRLFHLGLDAHVVGDMTTPPIGTGDLLIVSAGPGQFFTVLALMNAARNAGAEIMCITAQPTGEAAAAANHVIHIPAQTMADDQGCTTSVLPMGSLFEAVQFLFFEIVILQLRESLNIQPDQMRHNHTNLE